MVDVGPPYRCGLGMSAEVALVLAARAGAGVRGRDVGGDRGDRVSPLPRSSTTGRSSLGSVPPGAGGRRNREPPSAVATGGLLPLSLARQESAAGLVGSAALHDGNEEAYAKSRDVSHGDGPAGQRQE